MKNFTNKIVLLPFILMVGLILIQCGSSNRLREYEFRNKTAAARMATPPRAQVFSESFFNPGGGGIVSTALNIGTSIVKGVEAAKAQKRLNAAMDQVDVPEHIRRQTLKRCSEYLHFQPINSTSDADFLYLMKIKKYGIEADSWDSSVFFKIDVRIRLIDNSKNIEVWKRTVKERQLISGEVFGLGDAAGNVINAVALSQLTEEEMIVGFTHLAEYVADRIAERIQDDYIKAKSKED